MGFTYMSADQKADMLALFPKNKNLDFVCGWYKKAWECIFNAEAQRRREAQRGRVALVDKAYGRSFASDADRVAHLFSLYAAKVKAPPSAAQTTAEG